uniref:Uncharacterized protein n=1 Tax=Megaselia scalaris TaxID=36166 RepID=T1GRJ5_MEGSC
MSSVYAAASTPHLPHFIENYLDHRKERRHNRGMERQHNMSCPVHKKGHRSHCKKHIDSTTDSKL